MPRSQSISYDPISSGPFEGLFFGRNECRIGEMNIAGVTIAGASIGLSVRLRAIARDAANGTPPTPENDCSKEGGEASNGSKIIGDELPWRVNVREAIRDDQ